MCPAGSGSIQRDLTRTDPRPESDCPSDTFHLLHYNSSLAGRNRLHSTDVDTLRCSRRLSCVQLQTDVQRCEFGCSRIGLGCLRLVQDQVNVQVNVCWTSSLGNSSHSCSVQRLLYVVSVNHYSINSSTLCRYLPFPYWMTYFCHISRLRFVL